MSINVSLTLGNFPQGFCWQNAQQYGDALVSILTGTIPDLTGVIISDTTPAADDQDKLWIKTDLNGLPLGQFIYQGGWIWPHQIPASGKERMIWTGTEAELATYDGGVNVAVTTTTGPFWERDTAFDFRFPVGMGTNAIAYDGNPASSIVPTNTGGAERVALDATEGPVHTHDVYTKNRDNNTYWSGDINGAGKVATGASALAGGGDAAITALEPHFETDEAGGTGTPPVVVSHQNMPPYLCVIFAKRTARIFRTP